MIFCVKRLHYFLCEFFFGNFFCFFVGKIFFVKKSLF